MVSPIRRRAFNLMEMLIVIAIIAVLIALIIPAVQKVRAAAARTECAENLRALGTGFLKYHDLRKHLPQGGRNTPGTDPRTGKPFTQAMSPEDYSWCYHLLPYIGHGPMQEFDDGPLRSTPVPLFYCPARRTAQVYHGHGVCDYGGNGGTNDLNGAVVITGSPKLNQRAIEDGGSSTLLLGERRVNLAFLNTNADRHDNESCIDPGYDGDVIRWATRSSTAIGVAQDLSDSSLDPETPHHFFGSSHSTGMNVVFVDGSLRTMCYSIDPAVFRSVCVRNDTRNANLQ